MLQQTSQCCKSVRRYLAWNQDDIEPSSVNTALWIVIYLVLGIMMAVFVIAAVTMHWTPHNGKRCLPYGILNAFGFFLVTQIWSDSFLLFVIYEAISMLLALALYLSCFWFRREKGSGLLAAGIVVGIGGNVIEWAETAYSLINNSGSAPREARGGVWYLNASHMSSSNRGTRFCCCIDNAVDRWNRLSSEEADAGSTKSRNFEDVI